jgi:molybdenum cofactor biosynthesis enzyme MoaA
MAKVYCTAPWNGLTIREDGHVRTCCAGQKSLANLTVDRADDIENSSVLKEIQSAMLNGEPDLENCNSCINQEKISSHSSLRNHYNTFYPEFDPHQISLKFIDVRWNNTCNLSCMYCKPQFSSNWNDKQKKNNLLTVKPYQDELLSWILNRASQVKEILLVGGEPLLMKQNYELLKTLPNDCQISIITNLSYDLKNLPCLPDLLKRPVDKIIWNISADNTHRQFEYVRQGAKWGQLEENIKFLHQHWQNTLTMNMVYSMFNALDFLEIIKVFKSLGLQKFNLLPIMDNKSMVVFCMPQPIKQIARQILDQVVEYHNNSLRLEDRNLYPIQGIKQVSAHLENNNGQLISQSEFQKQIQWYDQWSAVGFRELWPNVIALTDHYLV